MFVHSSSQVAGCSIKHDMVMIVASQTSLKTANIFEVMHTLAMTLSVSYFVNIASVLLLLRQQLYLLQVADNQGHIVIFIMVESLC